ncbi:MAG: DUF1043 family protein [Xanthomonadales bacterium]|nr:DUF1043 family protein [Xanthomonadales bacterium]
MDPILSHILAAIAGALAGAGLIYLILGRGQGRGSAAAVRAEFDQYKEQVADHFSRTASAVNQLTDSYKSVFDELQEGASQLMDEDTLRQRLAHDDGEAITLSRLGYSAQPASGQSASEEAPAGTPEPAREDAAEAAGSGATEPESESTEGVSDASETEASPAAEPSTDGSPAEDTPDADAVSGSQPEQTAGSEADAERAEQPRP